MSVKTSTLNRNGYSNLKTHNKGKRKLNKSSNYLKITHSLSDWSNSSPASLITVEQTGALSDVPITQ